MPLNPTTSSNYHPKTLPQNVSHLSNSSYDATSNTGSDHNIVNESDSDDADVADTHIDSHLQRELYFPLLRK